LLLGMATPTLTVAEQRVRAAASLGEMADLTDVDDEERVVSAGVLRRLCTGNAVSSLDPRGVRIRGARVVDPLDLAFCTVQCPLQFERTVFEQPLELSRSRLRCLWLWDCSLPGLLAEWIEIDEVRLLGCTVAGSVRVVGAKIGGQLDCAGTTIRGASGSALNLQHAEIGGSLVLRGGLRATGETSLLGARIGGQVMCTEAVLENPGGDALSADNAVIAGAMFIRSSVTGGVRLVGANIGSLDCCGATFTNEHGIALNADGAEIAEVLLRDGFRADGVVRFSGAKIRGQLDCSAARLSDSHGYALFAERAEVGADVFLRDGFNANGAVVLLGARIGGQLDCQSAAFENEGGLALVVDGAEIAGDVFFRGGFAAKGGVRLAGAKIGGQLECVGATFGNEGGEALEAASSVVGRGVVISHFDAAGGVRFDFARIGGPFVCADAALANGPDFALGAAYAEIAGPLYFHKARIEGGVNLLGASVTTLDDDLGRDDLGSWQDVQPLTLDGFTYTGFQEATVSDSKRRCEWLKQTTGFQRGAWQQLIKVYRALGQPDDAKWTAIAMENERIKSGRLSRPRVAARQLLRVTIGHGYRPWLAGAWAVAIIAAFAVVVSLWPRLFHPASPGVTGSPQPVAYAADTFLPIVDLGQADDWQPMGWVRWVDWVVILLGWALTTIFVAGFTRIVRSE